jgi:hypothetical protein
MHRAENSKKKNIDKNHCAPHFTLDWDSKKKLRTYHQNSFKIRVLIKEAHQTVSARRKFITTHHQGGSNSHYHLVGSCLTGNYHSIMTGKLPRSTNSTVQIRSFTYFIHNLDL